MSAPEADPAAADRSDVDPAWRRATAADAVALLALERAASVIGLAHVFPEDRFPYPDSGVLARWQLVLADPDTVVDVLDGSEGTLDCVVAYDTGGTVRHLAVAPPLWGRGLGTRAIRHAESALGARGRHDLRLWCLEENARARRLYERLGWAATGATQPAPWPPYPTEMEYARRLCF